MNHRSDRNRTIALSSEEKEICLEQCIAAVSAHRNTDFTDRVIIGDCLAALPLLTPQSVDLVIADPPYNLSKKYAGSVFNKMSRDDYAEFTRSWIRGMLPVLKENASIYVCCDWRTSIVMGQVLGEFFLLKSRISWQREKGRGSVKNWKNSMEDIWFATVSENYVFNACAVKQRRRVLAPYRKDGSPKDWIAEDDGKYRDTYASNFWDDISIPFWSMPENTDHPAQKPEKLFAKLILASSSPGDVVLDPFAGVGTSAAVSRKLGRHFIAIEREPEYCALAMHRLNAAEADSSIQGYHDGVFWERNSFAAYKK